MMQRKGLGGNPGPYLFYVAGIANPKSSSMIALALPLYLPLTAFMEFYSILHLIIEAVAALE